MYAYEEDVDRNAFDTLVEYTSDDYDEQSAVVGKELFRYSYYTKAM